MEENFNKEKADEEFTKFTNGQIHTFDFKTFKNLVISELKYKNNRFIYGNKFCGFTIKQIRRMVDNPELYGESILRLCDYMYLKSGYFKRFIDYFVNGAILNWTVDMIDCGLFYKPDAKDIKVQKNFISFSQKCNSFRLENNMQDVLRDMYLHDACFCFVIKNQSGCAYYHLNPRYCEISKKVDGNVYSFSVNRSLALEKDNIKELPRELEDLLRTSYIDIKSDRIEIPLENSFCLKYNSSISYLYPPFFSMIADILEVDDYKAINKTKAFNEAQKILVFNVPIDKDTGNIIMSDNTVRDFIDIADSTIGENIAILPTPMTTEKVEFSTTSSSDKQYVENAINNMYSQVGVSQHLFSGSSSGSELKLSICNDNGDLFRIYRMLENWVRIQMLIDGYGEYGFYRLVYRILDMSIYNKDDFIDRQMKDAQASSPNKFRYFASQGMNPCIAIGNAYLENTIFSDLFDNLKTLQSAYQQSGKENTGGRPEVKDKAESTENGIRVDSNDKDNRI